MANSENYFALRIATLNSIGYCETVAVISYVDPRLSSHVLYGARIYTYGYFAIFLGLPLFIVTYAMLRARRGRAWQCFGSCFPILITSAIAMPVFRPEVPHGNLTMWTLTFSASAMIAAWLRNSGPNLAFVSNPKIPLQARLEGLKSMLAIWQTLTLGTGAAVLGALVPWGLAILHNNDAIVTKESERFILNSASIFQFGTVALALLIGPVRECIAQVLAIGAMFSAIRE